MKFFDYLHLKEVGVLELLFALYPILLGYQYGSIPLAILMLLIMDALALFKVGKVSLAKCKPMLYLFVFVFLHQVLWYVLVPELSGSFINNTLYYIIVFISFFLIGPALNFDKLNGSINWVALLVIGGLLYQIPIVLSGGFIQPLKLPFLPMPESSRLFDEVWRPTSFFWEPQSIVSFLLIPLFISLYESKYAWTVILAISMLLSTSTTGIVYVFTIIILTFVLRRKGLGSSWLLVFIVIGLYVALMNSDIFQLGTEKLLNSDITTDSRTAQGWWVCSTMPSQYWILGAPFEDAYHYYMAGLANNPNIVTYGESVYMATFWMVIFHFGIVGLFFYLMPYIFMLKRDRLIIPFMFCLIMALFSNPDFIKGSFVFDMVFAYVFINRNRIKYDNRSHRIRSGQPNAQLL